MQRLHHLKGLIEGRRVWSPRIDFQNVGELILVILFLCLRVLLAQVRGWSHGNLPKRDATRFFWVVKKFGDDSQIGLIASEVGGVGEAAPMEAEIELYDALIDGCREAVKGETLDPKGSLLDFFGVPVKTDEVLCRVEELQLLAKRISRYEYPISQFRALAYLKPATWSKGCGWNQKDDARLLLGIHYHGFGNWENVRLDERLGLTKKIAPVELQHHKTFLPRAPQLKERAALLLEMEVVAVGGKNSNANVGRKNAQKQKETLPLSHGKGRLGKSDSPRKVRTNESRALKSQKIEPLVKEEGEMSDNEEVYEQFKEVKWMEWCADVLINEEKTLRSLQKLQSISATLPKEKVLSKTRNYLQLLGRRIDQIVSDYEQGPYKQERMMTTRLWNYVSTFSNMSGEKLQQIYSKLKQEQHVAGGVGPFHINGQAAELQHLCRGILTWVNLKLGNGEKEPKQMLLIFRVHIKDPQVMGHDYLIRTLWDPCHVMADNLVMEGLTERSQVAFLQGKVSHLLPSKCDGTLMNARGPSN